MSDNGPQFVAAEFQDFANENSIKHIRSAPYHPANNGQVERAVQTLKAKLKAMENESGSLLQKLSRFLLWYRSTPHTTTGETPSELFIGRKLRTKLTLLKPNVAERMMSKQGDQKIKADQKSQDRWFAVGDLVWVGDYGHQQQHWEAGQIIKILGPVT